MNKPKTIWLIRVDYDGTTRSSCHPIGYVETLAEAKRFVRESKEGFFRDYQPCERKDLTNILTIV